MSAATLARPAELAVASDIVRRGVLAGPALVLVGALWRGGDGAIGAALAIAVVLVNFALSAAGIAWGAQRSQTSMVGAVMGGYALRLAIVTAALFGVRAASWADLTTFGITLLVTHVALLVWESRSIRLTLAAPGLAPGPLPTHGED